MNKIVLEICIDSVESAIAAELGGADRVELCANLFEGGTTPSYGMIEQVRKNISIDMNVIIRPRAGDFLYTEHEFRIMKKDIEIAKAQGANGVVIGILNPSGNIDIERTSELIQLAKPMSVTFHRAFDMAKDPFTSLEELISLGVDRLLTSGQERTALEGIDLLKELINLANDRIIIMPGAGVNERNIDKILTKTGAKEIHTSARKAHESKMIHRVSHVYMGGEFHQSEYGIKVTDTDMVQQLRRI